MSKLEVLKTWRANFASAKGTKLNTSFAAVPLQVGNLEARTAFIEAVGYGRSLEEIQGARFYNRKAMFAAFDRAIAEEEVNHG